MRKLIGMILIMLGFMQLSNDGIQAQTTPDFLNESAAARNARMAWWREARFGMFIHWGLYAIPAGEWQGNTNHAEWIRTTAQIPLKEYDQFVAQFNPVQFNPTEWVKLAQAAGMKYIVITSKHHDGFCLFDSKYTNFDIMATPFQRDILKELAAACRAAGIKMCWYHSIMDWHHPDYLPRRDWEKDRPTEGANFDRYVQHLKNQLQELVTNYGEISVLWFDGEWESTWNTQYGKDLYNYVRSLQPSIIINNRVGAGRSGMEGFTAGHEFSGDFGTPEQQIPATGLPGVDWETCMTMNDHWGYNQHDQNWKSTTDLIQKLADIASKGGNFLLNVGPTAAGLFPDASIERLREMGQWMQVNGAAIYGTQASPFKNLPWGRCTQKALAGGTRLYLHVFDWPANGKLVVPGIYNAVSRAFLLADPQTLPLPVTRDEDALVVTVPVAAPDPINSVVVLEIQGQPDINHPPEIQADFDIFADKIEVRVISDRKNVELRYTLDDQIPQISSPLAPAKILLTQTTTLQARCFRDGKAVSASVRKVFTKVQPQPARPLRNARPGIQFAYFEGDWDVLPDFQRLSPVQTGVLLNFVFDPRKEVEHFGFQYTGYIKIERTGVYGFYTESDDGSRLFIDDQLLVDNDGLHSLQEKSGVMVLAAGFHAIQVTFFEKTGGDGLKVSFQGPGIEKQVIPGDILFH